ncbi:MAG: hypothetical protein KatS3mg117_0831 [Geminicoccaceae bacterium]|jgi:hypothetical protein|nr:MAG: hypothetical protein KatS3mg117_0831 [Geminicoccaceae bacterium]
MSKDLLRLSQLVTSFGPGAMLDLPRRSVMIAGLDRWEPAKRRTIVEPRLVLRLPDGPRRGLATPPVHEESPYRRDHPGLQAILFPNWFVTTRAEPFEGRQRRRLVCFAELDQRSGQLVEGTGRDRKSSTVAPIRFVAACEHGHVQDIDWRRYVHRDGAPCSAPLWLEEAGATGDLAETWIACECGNRRPLYDALGPRSRALGPCPGRRPWLGPQHNESCDLHLRLLVRTASNAYFPVTVTALSLPTETEADRLERVLAEFERDLAEVTSLDHLRAALRFNARLQDAIGDADPAFVFEVLQRRRSGTSAPGKAVKVEEIQVLADPPKGRPADAGAVFVSEAVPRDRWDPGGRFSAIERLVVVHRLRVVTALRGFTRFDFLTADKDGELDPEIRVQELSVDPLPYPAIEQWGEGLFLGFDAAVVKAWRERADVQKRVVQLSEAFSQWCRERGREKAQFPGPVYVALHTLAHLLLAEIALDCGYPLASLRERVYATPDERFGILLYAASTDVGGTLGGLVALGSRIGELLERAAERAAICAHDPVCAEHDPGRGGGHRLAGAACHGCVLLPEPCCEMRNDFLDRALAVGTLAHPGLGLLRPGPV